MNLKPGVDKVTLAVPLYHCFGSILGYMAFMMHGCGVILPSFGFDAEAALKAVSSQKATALRKYIFRFSSTMVQNKMVYQQCLLLNWSIQTLKNTIYLHFVLVLLLDRSAQCHS